MENIFEVQFALYPEMIPVEGGTFEIGDELGQGFADELPVHSVSLLTFSMAKTQTGRCAWITYCEASGRSMSPKSP